MAVKYTRESLAESAGRRATPYRRLPGRRGLSSRQRFGLLYAGLFFAALVLYAGGSIFEMQRYRDQPILTGTGAIEKISGNDKERHLVISIVPEGAPEAVSGEIDVTGPEWKNARPGAPVEVAYRLPKAGNGVRIQGCRLIETP